MIKCVCRNIADEDIHNYMDTYHVTYTEAFRALLEMYSDNCCGKCDEGEEE